MRALRPIGHVLFLCHFSGEIVVALTLEWLLAGCFFKPKGHKGLR
jgi:hypothetical protein